MVERRENAVVGSVGVPNFSKLDLILDLILAASACPSAEEIARILERLVLLAFHGIEEIFERIRTHCPCGDLDRCDRLG